VPKATESSELAIARANLNSAEQTHDEVSGVYMDAVTTYNTNQTDPYLIERLEAAQLANNQAIAQVNIARNEVERLTG
jgi:hypothetical protein